MKELAEYKTWELAEEISRRLKEIPYMTPNEMPTRKVEQVMERFSKPYKTDPEVIREIWLAGWDYCRDIVRSKIGIKI